MPGQLYLISNKTTWFDGGKNYGDKYNVQRNNTREEQQEIQCPHKTPWEIATHGYTKLAKVKCCVATTQKVGGGGELIAQRKALLCLLSFLFIRHRLQRSHKYDAHYSLVRMDLKMIAQRKALLCLLSFLFIKHRLQRSHKYDNHDSLVRMDLKLYG